MRRHIATEDLTRSTFERRMTKYRQSGKKVKVSPSSIQLEAEILNGTTIRFALNPAKGDQTATERRLNVNDLIEFSRIRFALKEVDTTTGFGHGIAPLVTWPNPSAFTAASGFTVAHLEAIYNGTLQIVADSEVLIDSLSMRNFLDIPEWNSNNVTAAFGYGYVNAASADDEVSQSFKPLRDPWHDAMGEHSLPTSITIPGHADVEILIKLPSEGGYQIQATATGKKNFAVLIFDGILSKGAVK